MIGSKFKGNPYRHIKQKLQKLGYLESKVGLISGVRYRLAERKI